VKRSLSLGLPAFAVAAVAIATLTCGSPDAAGGGHASARGKPGAQAAGGQGGAAATAPATAKAGTAGAPRTVAPGDDAVPGTPAADAAQAAAVAAWDVVYGVLQHPRCANCHPGGNAPLQGDAMLVHAQNVQRGADGKGLFGMHCSTCHQTRNLESPHLPPGAPEWHLPAADMPLVFVGMSERALCEQMRDPRRNGGKTPEQLYEHMNTPLVLWGWDPGPGRVPVPTSHDALMTAMRTWIDGGCGCPDK